VVSLLRICAKVRPLGKIYKGSSLEELGKLRSEKLEEFKEGSLRRLQKKGVSLKELEKLRSEKLEEFKEGSLGKSKKKRGSLEKPEEKDSDEFRKK